MVAASRLALPLEKRNMIVRRKEILFQTPTPTTNTKTKHKIKTLLSSHAATLSTQSAQSTILCIILFEDSSTANTS